MNKLYFSFIGGARGIKISDDRHPQYLGETIFNFSTYDRDSLFSGTDIIKHTQSNEYVYVCDWSERLEVDWETGEKEKVTNFSYYLVKKQSFDCCPAVPVREYGDNVYNALFY